MAKVSSNEEQILDSQPDSTQVNVTDQTRTGGSCSKPADNSEDEQQEKPTPSTSSSSSTASNSSLTLKSEAVDHQIVDEQNKNEGEKETEKSSDGLGHDGQNESEIMTTAGLQPRTFTRQDIVKKGCKVSLKTATSSCTSDASSQFTSRILSSTSSECQLLKCTPSEKLPTRKCKSTVTGILEVDQDLSGKFCVHDKGIQEEADEKHCDDEVLTDEIECALQKSPCEPICDQRRIVVVQTKNSDYSVSSCESEPATQTVVPPTPPNCDRLNSCSSSSCGDCGSSRSSVGVENKSETFFKGIKLGFKSMFKNFKKAVQPSCLPAKSEAKCVKKDKDEACHKEKKDQEKDHL